MTVLLEGLGLACVRGQRRLFQGLDVQLAGGELLRVAGANGAGKTSLLRMLCGLLAPAQGQLRWRGRPLRAAREDLHRDLVYLGHAAALKDELSALENLHAASRIGGVLADDAAARAALAAAGLGEREHWPVRTLSQGQRRRAALARLAVTDAALWVLDEPFNALDSAATNWLLGLIGAQLGARRRRRADQPPAGRAGSVAAAAQPGAVSACRAGDFDAVRERARRDLRIALRRRADSAAALVFFVIVVSLFPLGVGPQPSCCAPWRAGVVWVAALLASMLSLGRLFADDHADGTLEQLLLSPTPLALLVGAKVARALARLGPAAGADRPLLALQFDLGAPAAGVLLVSLLLGTPVLSLIGAIGAALTVGLRGAGVLLSLLVLPLDRAGADLRRRRGRQSAQAGLGVGGHFSLLGAMLVLALFAAPLAAAPRCASLPNEGTAK